MTTGITRHLWRRRRCRSAAGVLWSSLLFLLTLALGLFFYDRKQWRKNARRIIALDLSLALERNRSAVLALVVAKSLVFRNHLRVLSPPRNADKYRLAEVRAQGDLLGNGLSEPVQRPMCAPR